MPLYNQPRMPRADTTNVIPLPSRESDPIPAYESSYDYARRVAQEELNAQDDLGLEQKRQQIMDLADDLFAGQSVLIGQEGRKKLVALKDVHSEQVNHPLFDHANEQRMLGNPGPLDDLDYRIAQYLIAQAMGIHRPEELGFIA